MVEDSAYKEYFVNMAGAEEELYNKWKELTLNNSGNPSKYRYDFCLQNLACLYNLPTIDYLSYRVWDYPIREQYTHVMRVIEETGPVRNEDEGFAEVLKSESGEYAFIHDAARIR